MPSMARTPLGSQRMFTIGRKTFEDIEDFIADNKASAEKAALGIDLLVRAMVLLTKGLAQQKSGGPIAPAHRSNPALANRIPVQQITGRYFAGWTQRKVANGVWVLYNDSVEAYLIETGMFQRVRRPILKMSLIGMLGVIQTTRTADRFLEWVLAPRRSAKGQFQSFGSRVGSGILSTGMSYSDSYGGSSSGKGATVNRNVLAARTGRLPG